MRKTINYYYDLNNHDDGFNSKGFKSDVYNFIISPLKEENKNITPVKNLEGIDGWLCFFGILLVLHIIGMLFQVFKSGGDNIYNAIFLCGDLFFVYLFFSRSKYFPKIYIGVNVLLTLLGVLTILGGGSSHSLVMIVAATIIMIVALLPWTLYMVFSKRVKATFTK